MSDSMFEDITGCHNGHSMLTIQFFGIMSSFLPQDDFASTDLIPCSVWNWDAWCYNAACFALMTVTGSEHDVRNVSISAKNSNFTVD